MYPSPAYPALQEQMNDPSVLLHDANALHGLFVSHSFVSKKIKDRNERDSQIRCQDLSNNLLFTHRDYDLQ